MITSRNNQTGTVKKHDWFSAGQPMCGVLTGKPVPVTRQWIHDRFVVHLAERFCLYNDQRQYVKRLSVPRLSTRHKLTLAAANQASWPGSEGEVERWWHIPHRMFRTPGLSSVVGYNGYWLTGGTRAVLVPADTGCRYAAQFALVQSAPFSGRLSNYAPGSDNRVRGRKRLIPGLIWQRLNLPDIILITWRKRRFKRHHLAGPDGTTLLYFLPGSVLQSNGDEQSIHPGEFRRRKNRRAATSDAQKIITCAATRIN